MMKAATN